MVPYSTLATSENRALVIYLLDVSSSMGQSLGGKTRIQAVVHALDAALQRMTFRSTKGALVAPRYRIAVYAYSDKVYDVLGGIRTIDEIGSWAAPDLKPLRTTETAQAFAQAEKLLLSEIPQMMNCPAPLVCHMTDGEYTGADPEPVVREIMSLSVPDGSVLVENIFIANRLLDEAVGDARTWPGVDAATPLSNDYARKLRDMSSSLPASYRAELNENGCGLSESAVMMLPGESAELVSLGFQMSAATPTRQTR